MLKKISWKFRKTHISLTPLTIFINEKWDGWGFGIFNVTHNLWGGSLLKMTWFLPNGADKKFTFSGDLLFLRQHLLNKLSDLDDRALWGTATIWDVNLLWILRIIFK
jgi:hypothetical protein|tara:strand:- start:36 stop:356 length:321 start_codon:yes stop_codon:yes gene_type:complete